jgi:hypothetical protein
VDLAGGFASTGGVMTNASSKLAEPFDTAESAAAYFSFFDCFWLFFPSSPETLLVGKIYSGVLLSEAFADEDVGAFA